MLPGREHVTILISWVLQQEHPSTCLQPILRDDKMPECRCLWRTPSAGLRYIAQHLACLWRRYVRSHLLSSDYEGCVTLWDVDTGLAVNEYEAHDKRIWSVDFCTADPSLFVSGSDDGWIKVLYSCSHKPCLSPASMITWPCMVPCHREKNCSQASAVLVRNSSGRNTPPHLQESICVVAVCWQRDVGLAPCMQRHTDPARKV